jgi:hypothetical protein
VGVIAKIGKDLTRFKQVGLAGGMDPVILTDAEFCKLFIIPEHTHTAELFAAYPLAFKYANITSKILEKFGLHDLKELRMKCQSAAPASASASASALALGESVFSKKIQRGLQ